MYFYQPKADMGKKRYRGHYCWVCRRIRPNEKFSGKGHAKHICRECELKMRAKAREKRRLERTLVLGSIDATSL